MSAEQSTVHAYRNVGADRCGTCGKDYRHPNHVDEDQQSCRRDDELQLLKLHGTDNQRERWSARLLPEDELLAIARNVLFAPFADFRRWSKLSTFDVRHERGCVGGGVTFDTRKPTALTADEWTIYKKISDIAMDHASHQICSITYTPSVVEHVGRCSACASEVFGRAASIRIEWAGRPLSREYSLEVQ